MGIAYDTEGTLGKCVSSMHLKSKRSNENQVTSSASPLDNIKLASVIKFLWFRAKIAFQWRIYYICKLQVITIDTLPQTISLSQIYVFYSRCHYHLLIIRSQILHSAINRLVHRRQIHNDIRWGHSVNVMFGRHKSSDMHLFSWRNIV